MSIHCGAAVRRVVFVVGSGRSGTQHDGRHAPDAGHARAAARGRRRRHQPARASASRSGSSTCTPSSWRAATSQVSDARPARLVRDRQAQADHGLLRTRVTEWLEPQFADGGDELVIKDPRLAWFLGPLARRARSLRRHAVVRHDAAPRDRGRRHQEAVLRPAPAATSPHRRVGQHDAAHRARHPRLMRAVRPVRRPAGRLDHPAVPRRRGLRPARGEEAIGQRHRAGPQVHRPGRCTGSPSPGTTSRCRPRCASSRRRPGRR